MGLSSETLWIFGYGSLVWRPGFEHERSRPGWIHGWSRRFWQGSTDHRGVPGAPGRVVTLVPDEHATCGGMVFEVSPAQRAAVFERLDYREKGGYERLQVSVNTRELGEVEAVTYLATESNPNWLGPASIEAIASQVRGARGPSGDNVEYVLRLVEALSEIDVRDPHVEALAQALALESR